VVEPANRSAALTIPAAATAFSRVSSSLFSTLSTAARYGRIVS
jgi:hypothetical protein